MQISYAKLFDKLKANGITQKVFKEKANISSRSLASMSKNASVTTDTICKICDFSSVCRMKLWNGFQTLITKKNANRKKMLRLRLQNCKRN